MEGQPLRVVLVDDHEMVRTGLKAMLSRFTGQVRVVGEAADAATARRGVAGLDPDIVLADVRLGGESGLDRCTVLIRDPPGRRGVLQTVYVDELSLFQAMQAGAACYLLKRIDGPELVEQLRRVHAGGGVVDAGLSARAGASAGRLRAGGDWPRGDRGRTTRRRRGRHL